jgi:hypothetical protein
MEKMTLYLPSDLRRALQEQAHRTGKAQAELAREALRAYLKGVALPKPRSLGLGEDDGLAARDSEAWLAPGLSRR